MAHNRIHHTCRCAGLQFTFEEWIKWIKDHGEADSFKFVAASHNGFDFNINDVCLTPNISIDWRNKCCSFEIRTAQSPNGRWDYGKMYRFHNSGGGHAVSFVSQPEKGYPTEKEAVYAALLRLEHDANRELSDCSHDRDTDEEDGGMKNSSAAPYIRSALKQIEEYKQLFNPQQLSLFE